MTKYEGELRRVFANNDHEWLRYRTLWEDLHRQGVPVVKAKNIPKAIKEGLYMGFAVATRKRNRVLYGKLAYESKLPAGFTVTLPPLFREDPLAVLLATLSRLSCCGHLLRAEVPRCAVCGRWRIAPAWMINEDQETIFRLNLRAAVAFFTDPQLDLWGHNRGTEI